jgi:hypothetical protein
MWIGKNSSAPAKPKAKTAAQPASPVRELHVSHHVESEIAAFLVQKGRLEMRVGKHLLHFIAIDRNKDGTVDYTVRTRMHLSSGLERNFTSSVRIFPDRRLQLVA